MRFDIRTRECLLSTENDLSLTHNERGREGGRPERETEREGEKEREAELNT